MPNLFQLTDTRPLVDCAMGRLPADLGIRNGRWVCVQTGEIIPNTDIAILAGRVAYVGPDASHTLGESTQILEAGERYLVPGLLDAHMHVESGMLTVTEFVRAVLPHGTTGMFIDPHEIANVFGLPGVRLMVDEALIQPIHVFVQMPSCVPSAPGLETSGAVIGVEEVAEALSWQGIIGLGEMMNFPAVVNGDPSIHAELTATRLSGKIIGGHFPMHNQSRIFNGYAAGGAMDDHEGTSREDAVARARQGMRVMMRYGSAWHDVAEQVRAVTEDGMDPRMFLLCTDDSHSGTLISEGHMDWVVRFAISQGLPPVQAIQMATINTAEHFGVSREMGMIAPGRYADILLVDNLEHFNVEVVVAKGLLAAENGRLRLFFNSPQRPDWVTHSVKLPKPVTADDFRLKTSIYPVVNANVIGIIENQAPTRHLNMELPVHDGEVHPDLLQDVAKLALIDRHHGTGEIKLGFVHGFGFTESCAVASTVAHDSHHLLVVGTDEDNMAIAANRIAECGGGQVVVRNKQVIGKVELPVGGLMSDQPAMVVAQQVEEVLQGFRDCGCSLNNPNMQLSLLALVVIPELRISNQGLVDVTQFKIIPTLES